ncbi:hypothetical protein [Corallococcus sp. EGB]|uniref:hypothetical protein n=1 Tax=Corallococcus sp. EGB TaxID=1521117 RepID=UPI001CBF2484|nr:hypothetical protein [Corallococcus sp. EGB]
MRSRVLFPLCLAGLLLACASGSRSTTPEAASSDAGPVQPCTTNPPPPAGGVVVNITASTEGKVHFSTKTVRVQPGQTVSFVSQVQQDRCIGVSKSGFLADGSPNPLSVPGCQVASWTMNTADHLDETTAFWSCPTSDCSKCAQPKGSIKDTINGTLEVSGRGED